MKYDIILAGVGGQGVLSLSGIIALSALEEGYYAKQSEVHGMAQRGGAVSPGQPSRPAEDESPGPDHGHEQEKRPESAEAAFEAGEKVVAPDIEIGQVVGDAEVGTTGLQPLGPG